MRRPFLCFLWRDIAAAAAAAPGINHASGHQRKRWRARRGRKGRKIERGRATNFLLRSFFPPPPSLPFPSRVINTPFFLPPHSGCPSRTSPRPSFPDLPLPLLSLSLSLSGRLFSPHSSPPPCQRVHSRVESTESPDRRPDNRAEVAVTATAAASDGESSVKTCFSLFISQPHPSLRRLSSRGGSNLTPGIHFLAILGSVWGIRILLSKIRICQKSRS